MTTFDLFYSPTPELSIFDLDQIIHSLITYGDSVWLKSDIELSRNIDPEMKKQMTITLNELIEGKFIKLWSLENSNTNGYLDRILTIEENKELNSRVNDAITNRQIEGSNLLSGKNIDKVTRFIELRQELWNLGIASSCNANSIIYGKSKPNYIDSSTHYKYEKINKKFTKTLFKTFNIPSLIGLKTQDILELKTQAEFVRKKIDPFIDKFILEFGIPEDKILKKCNGIYQEYLKEIHCAISEKTQKGVIGATVKDSFYTITGLVFSVVGIIPIAKRL